MMCTSGTHFTRTRVSIGSSVCFVWSHFLSSQVKCIPASRAERHVTPPVHRREAATPLVHLHLVTEACLLPAPTYLTAERGSLLSCLQKESITWFWGWRYQCAWWGSEVRAWWAGKVLPSPFSGALTHSCAGHGEPVLPGGWCRMQPMAKVASESSKKKMCRVPEDSREQFLKMSNVNLDVCLGNLLSWAAFVLRLYRNNPARWGLSLVQAASLSWVKNNKKVLSL